MPKTAIQTLMTAVVQEQDVDLARRALEQVGAPSAHLASAGGFLGRRNATLLIGLPDGQEDIVLKALQQSCHQRIEYLAIPLEGSPLPMPTRWPTRCTSSWARP